MNRVSHCCFICVFLVTDVEHLSISLFVICTFSLVRCLLIWLTFYLCLFSYCWVLTVLCIFCKTVLYQKCILQIFSPSLYLIFSFTFIVFCRPEIFFILMMYILPAIWKHDSTFGVAFKNLLINSRLLIFYPMLSSQCFIVLCFTFRSMISLNLNFIMCVKSVSRITFYMWMSSFSNFIVFVKTSLFSSKLLLLFCQR